jgi:uncharacterized oligopeptide transporter (OPT) family protein
MAGGIPHVPAFVIGLIAGCVMAIVGLPVMTLGLGVYLPFYLSSGAAVGAVVRAVFERKNKKANGVAKATKESHMQAVASGMLGGESLVGVLVALIALGATLIG